MRMAIMVSWPATLAVQLFRDHTFSVPLRSRPRLPSAQALQFRLREDLKAAGGDLAAFDQLKEVRAWCQAGGRVWATAHQLHAASRPQKGYTMRSSS